ncbi:adenylyl-sulfate kinase [Paenibacillus agricola]|uniref:Adenylyl-sulfate kinase n=1 Tax=Paenibacillus agricola TaxID=2716264 RepID=A0ABX0JFN5_9BACL|nr:adenylyl-sulfate kinase [Paenibacillus agricola]
MENSGKVLWFTGLSGSGKTTTAEHVYKRLAESGQPVELLDGDAVRSAICKGLGFNREDRIENIHRIAYVADLLSRHGIVVLVSAITPYREMREYLKSRVTGYVEIYVNCSLDVCEARDVKGLYAKARRQEITMFTGISDPYDEPEQADIVLDTFQESVETNVNRILEWLERNDRYVKPPKSYVAAGKETDLTADSVRIRHEQKGDRG